MCIQHAAPFPEVHQDRQPPIIYYPEAVFLDAFSCEPTGKRPSISERRRDWFPLSESAGDGNTWHCPSVRLGKCSPSQCREQCKNSEPSSWPQCLLGSLKSSRFCNVHDRVAEETGSQGHLFRGNSIGTKVLAPVCILRGSAMNRVPSLPILQSKALRGKQFCIRIKRTI